MVRIKPAHHDVDRDRAGIVFVLQDRGQQFGAPRLDLVLVERAAGE